MWFVLGILAIAFSISNIGLFVNKKDYRLAMALGLSFTALTLCSFYNQVSYFVLKGDMSALLDIVPTVSPILWVLTLISIFINVIPICFDYRNRVKKQC